jgi:hypothetical protein
MADRSKPPEGYHIFSDLMSEQDPGSWGAAIDCQCDLEYATKAEALVACWAHHDAIEARGYAECQADVVAMLRDQARQWGGSRDVGAVAFETAGAVAFETAADMIECDRHIGTSAQPSARRETSDET